MMIREYLKLSRSFNAVLTGVSPVMGAIAMEQYNIVILALLFLVGYFGHSFGFVLNDIIDYKIDKSSEEISDRPLISGTISIKKAWIFAIASMIVAFIIALYIAIINQNFFPVLILAVSAFFITLYDMISKKYPFMDIFVSFGIFFLILYGSFYGKTSVKSIYDISKLTWTVCVLGSIQVLFMQAVAGGMKDIENDFMKGAKTSAIKMGVRIADGTLKISLRFKAFAYFVQMADMIIVFLPFFIIWEINNPSVLQYFQWVLLGVTGVMMFILSHRLLSMKQFDRSKARKFIGSHYVTNFALVPIMLMTLNPWAGLLIFFPALGYILSNIILHGTILQAKTM